MTTEVLLPLALAVDGCCTPGDGMFWAACVARWMFVRNEVFILLFGSNLVGISPTYDGSDTLFKKMYV